MRAALQAKNAQVAKIFLVAIGLEIGHTSTMHKQHAFTLSQTGAGNTVLFYNRRTNDPIKRITADNVARRVAMVGDILTVDGVSVMGWTVAVKA